MLIFALRLPAEAQQAGHVPTGGRYNSAPRAFIEDMRDAFEKGGLSGFFKSVAVKARSAGSGGGAKRPFSVSPSSPFAGKEKGSNGKESIKARNSEGAITARIYVERSPLDRTLDYINLLHAPKVIERRLAVTGARPVVHIRHESVYEPARVREFYKKRGFAPAWSGLDGPGPIARAMVRFLYEADPVGLIRPGRYHLMAVELLMDEAGRLKQHGEVLNPSFIADFDILLTDAYMQYVSELSQSLDGRGPQGEFLVERLNQTVNGNESIENLISNIDPSYESLPSALDQTAEAVNPYTEDPYSLGARLLIRSRVGTHKNKRKIKIRDRRIKNPRSVARFYEVNNYGLAWSSHRSGYTGGLNDQARIMHGLIERAAEEGLRAADYHASAIRDAAADLQSGDNTLFAAADLDILLTDAFFLYASHQLGGRSVIKTVDVRSVKERPAPDIVKALTRALETGRLEATLKGLAPNDPAYVKLRQALALYRDIGARGGWSKIGGGRTMRTGDKGERVQQLHHRLLGADRSAFYSSLGPSLESLGESGSGSGFGIGIYNGALRTAVAGFQKSHGLRETGRANSATIRALNVNVEERISQIELNMERWRWYGEILGERYIVVNAADYTMEVVEGGKSVMKMKAIVGKRHTKTPVFASEIEYMVLNPYWYAPASIEKGLIQPPGPTNPLGRVKFIFPNRYSVYLHDTPTKHLFANNSRLYSHGCVRLERALDLAEYILQDVPDWDAERMRGVLKGRRTRRIYLPDPMPVYILYWTTWVDDEGHIQFRGDPYGRDRKVRKVIN